MPIIVPDIVETKGRKDARRHRDKQKELIKKYGPQIIAEESIITGTKDKIIKVPIKSLQNPRFRQGKRQDGKESEGGGIGIGQGSNNPGDIIGSRPGPGKRPGQTGSEPGIDVIETEIELAEFIAMMFEDIGLPNLEEKEIQELEIITGIKLEDISHSGPWSLLHRRKTAREGLKRFYALMQYLQHETKRSEHDCFWTLKTVQGRLDEALLLLRDPAFIPEEKNDPMVPFPIFHNIDLRFWRPEEDIEYKSNAVIHALMDVSGSMTTEKKYLVRSMLFWIVQLLRTLYDNVEVRFITHTTTAQLVEEKDFFTRGSSGGTTCSSAYELARMLIDTQYPSNRWNNYVFHFSDGEDDDPKKTANEIKKIIDQGVQMIGYGEVHVDSEYDYSGANLLAGLKTEFQNFGPSSYELQSGVKVVSYTKKFPFVAVVIAKREHVYPAIKEFLQKGRWGNDAKRS